MVEVPRDLAGGVLAGRNYSFLYSVMFIQFIRWANSHFNNLHIKQSLETNTWQIAKQTKINTKSGIAYEIPEYRLTTYAYVFYCY